MTVAIHTTIEPNANSATTMSQTLSVADAAIVIDTLMSIRVTANTTACLANHMKRDGVEDFADGLVADIDDHLEAMVMTLKPRSSSEAQALVARIEAIIGEVRHD